MSVYRVHKISEVTERPIILGTIHKITIFFSNSSCPKYVLLRPLFWFLGEGNVQMEEVVWSWMLTRRTHLQFSLKFIKKVGWWRDRRMDKGNFCDINKTSMMKCWRENCSVWCMGIHCKNSQILHLFEISIRKHWENML